MRLGDVVDELLNEHGLSDSGTSEKSNLSSTRVGSEEVDDLDSGLEDLGGGGLVHKLRRVGVDGTHGDTDDGASLVDGLTDHVHDAAETGGSDGDEDGGAGVDDLLASDETLSSCTRASARTRGRNGKTRTVHGDGADRVLSQVHRDLEHETVLESLHLEGVEDRGEVLRVELNVHDGTNHGLDLSDGVSDLGRVRASCSRAHSSATARVRTRADQLRAVPLILRWGRVALAGTRAPPAPGAGWYGAKDSLAPALAG